MNIHRVVVTGGGTAGHVLPIIPLIEKLVVEGVTVNYIGSKGGIEKDLVNPLNIAYTPIRTGKLRRYFSFRNLVDLFQVPAGIFEALKILRQIAPDIVFSKGGYVAFPVVVAAWVLGIPVVAHESDLSPGLANRLCLPFLETLCVNFSETKVRVRRKVVTGIPLRRELLEGDRNRGRNYLGISDPKRQVLLVFGGSLGAEAINRLVRACLPILLKTVDVIHVCGKDKIDTTFNNLKGYIQKEFVSDEWGDVLAATDAVVSRAGANSIYELIALRIPHLLIPLPLSVSRGDQLENAALMAGKGLSMVRHEEDLAPDNFLECIKDLMDGAKTRKEMDVISPADPVSKIIDELIYAFETFEKKRRFGKFQGQRD